MSKTCLTAAAALLAVLAAPALGHHSAAAYFNLDEEITVTGTVDELVFRAPHAVLRFTVTNEDGEDVLWRAETLPSNLLYHRGWRYNMFEPGEEVTVTGNPARDPDVNGISLSRLETGDGRVVTPGGIEEPD